jgi:hypothetical protein
MDSVVSIFVWLICKKSFVIYIVRAW